MISGYLAVNFCGEFHDLIDNFRLEYNVISVSVGPTCTIAVSQFRALLLLAWSEPEQERVGAEKKVSYILVLGFSDAC